MGLSEKRIHIFLFFNVFIIVEDIIKKILLNMNYDSRKTLKENKTYILKEDKTDSEKNIEYKKETAPDGSSFDLRTDAYEIVKVPTPSMKDKSFFSETCKWIQKYPKYSDYKFKDMETCMKDYNDGFINSLSTNFVKSFKLKDKLDVFDEKEWKFEFCGGFYNYNTKRMELPNKWKFDGYFAKRPLENTEDKNCGSLEYISGNQKKGTNLSGTQDKGSKEGDSKSAMIKTGTPISGSQTGSKTLGIGLGKGAGGGWIGDKFGTLQPPPDNDEREADIRY